MTHPDKTVRTTATVVGLVYALALYLAGVKLNGQLKHGLSYLPSVLTLLVVAFDKWVWKSPLVLRWHKRPRLDGLWKVVLQPDSDSHIPEGGNRGPIDGYLVVEQSFWSISITQFTAESSSFSKAETFLRHKDSAQTSLAFLFDNTPKREHLTRSPRSCGGCILNVAAGSPKTMTGSYFTDRFTAGSMTVNSYDRTTNYADFAEADRYTKEHEA